MPRNRENRRIFEPIFEPQFDGFCVKIEYKIATFWVAGQQFIGHPVYPPSGGFLVVELQPFSLRKDTKIEIFGGKMTHVPPLREFKVAPVGLHHPNFGLFRKIGFFLNEFLIMPFLQPQFNPCPNCSKNPSKNP